MKHHHYEITTRLSNYPEYPVRVLVENIKTFKEAQGILQDLKNKEENRVDMWGLRWVYEIREVQND